MPAPHDNLLVDTQSHLDEICAAVAQTTQIAIDTEFVRTNTYAPHLGLLQIATPEIIACVDPLADMNLDELWSLLFDHGRQSTIHSGSQDMEVLWYTCERVVMNLVDTQVCAALLGYPAQIGYAGLAADLVGAEIAKTQTRTDWSRRPLSAAQIAYAAEDVEHLAEMHALLKQRLDDLGRYEWALADSAALSNVELYQPDPESAWQRLKSIPFLPPAQQARARALAEWRERRAVHADKPRSWILADKALLQLAEANPHAPADLRKIPDLPAAVIRKQGERLLHIMADANSALASGAVNYTQEFPERDKDKARVKACSRIIRAKADELGIAPEVLGSKRDIQALLKGDAAARLASGWRRELFGDELIQIAAQQ